MSFDDFLSKLNSEEAEKQRVEAEKPKRKADWVASINQVFAQVEILLKSHSESGRVTLTYGAVHSNDIDIGPVEVRMLTICGSSGKGRGAVSRLQPPWDLVIEGSSK